MHKVVRIECMMKKLKLDKKTIYQLLIVLFFAFTVIFYSPLELCAGNAHDIYFSFGSYVIFMGIFSVVVVAVLYVILRMLPEKISERIALFLFSITLAGYVQQNFMNGSLGVMDGRTYSFSEHMGATIISLVVWVLVVVLPQILLTWKRKECKKGAGILSAALIVMQMTGMISLLFTTELTQMGSKSSVIGSVTYDDVFTLAPKQNVVVFILDAFDERYMDDIYWHDPDALTTLNGFTYFHNSTSRYEATVPSLTYLMTGQEYDYQIPFETYVEYAWNNSFMLADLKSKGFDIRALTDARYFGNTAYSIVDNLSHNTARVKPLGMFQSMMRLSAFRMLPNLCKQPFNFDTTMINTYATDGDSHYTFDDEGFYDKLLQEGIQVTEETGSVRIYHLEGTHPPYTYGRDGRETNGTTTPEEEGIGALTIVNQYLSDMKEQKIFDDSLIIITADHGEPPEETIVRPSTPIFCVKPIGRDDSESYQVDSAPISQENYAATIMKELGYDETAYGTSAFDVQEGASVTRNYYFVDSADEDNPKVVEYEINGPASDLNNWSTTGTVLDKKY